MPKLNGLCRSTEQKERGSVLVGIFAFTIVLFIASLGYLQVLTSIQNGETEAYRDNIAFCAAESGLYLGISWHRQNPAAWPTQAGTVSWLYDPLTINDMNVTVKDSAGAAGTLFIIARATSPRLAYAKILSWEFRRSTLPSGSYGVYLFNAWELGGNTKGLRKFDWDGPAHYNTALKLGNPGGGNESHWNDRVTVYNIDPATNLPVYRPNQLNPGHFGNDYRYGVEGGSGNWDSEFQRTYNGQSDRVVTDLKTDGQVNISLSATAKNLTFLMINSVPHYRYTDAANILQTVAINPATNLMLHIVNSTVSVSGTVAGKVTVVTDAGRNISMAGDLTYADLQASSFSSTDTAGNYGYGRQSTNVIALHSGGNIDLPAEKEYKVTGQLFATQSSTGTISFASKKASINLFGTLAVRQYWDSKQGNDQSIFKQRWDRRQLHAPGLSYTKVDGQGNPANNLKSVSWSEANK